MRYLPQRCRLILPLIIAGLVSFLCITSSTTTHAVVMQEIAPDLVVTTTTAPARIDANQPRAYVEIAWTVKNQGQGATPDNSYWYDSVYLSTDTQYDAADSRLTTVGRVSNLAPSASYERTASMYLPNELANSTYYFIVRTDTGYWGTGNDLTETNDNNNARTSVAVPFTLTLPDLIVTSVIPPTRIDVNQPHPYIELKWTVKNQGQGAATVASYWYDSIYLSVDAQYDAADTRLITVDRREGLAPGASYEHTYSMYLPNELANGSYYFIVRADTGYWGDTGNDTIEVNEDNNGQASLAVPFTLTLPDLMPTQLTIPSRLDATQPHAQFEVSWTVTNQGTGAIPESHYWYDNLYLSTDASWDANDSALGGYWGWSRSGSVAAGGNYSQTVQVSMPEVVPGTYYLLVKADHQDRLAETSNENNTIVSNPFIYTLTLPDLVPTALTAPTRLDATQPRAQFEVSWTVTNQGAGAVPESHYWYDNLYLSTDASWDANDSALGGYWGWSRSGSVATGASYIQTVQVSMPEVAAGTYYLLIKADHQDRLVETSKDNNVRAVPFTYTLTLPDLVPTALTAPTRLDASQPNPSFEATWMVANQSTVEVACCWYDNLYLSTDATWDQNDRYLSWHWAGPIAAGATAEQRMGASLPSDIAPGTYYLILRTAPDNSYPVETSKDNNTIVSNPFTYTLTLPDLVPTALTAPTRLDASQPNPSFEATWMVANQSTVEVACCWYDNLYLSTDATWDQDDRYLSWHWAGPIAAGATAEQRMGASLPSDIAPGTYYLILRTAPDNSYPVETSKDNNTIVSNPFTYTLTLPDLVPTALTAPTRLDATQPGPYFEVNWTVINQSSVEVACCWYDNLYLSTDATWDQNDRYLSWHWAGPIAAGATAEQRMGASLPSDIAPGTYYLILRTAPDNSYPVETSKDNNTIVSNPFTYTLTLPDLVPTALTAPTRLDASQPNQEFEISWTIQNQGEGMIPGGWYDAVYLSTNTTWDDQDIGLGSAYYGQDLEPGASYDYTIIARLPDVPSGTYYVILRTNPYNYRTESNTHNNIFVRTEPLQYTFAPPDILPQSLTAPSSITLHQSQPEIEVSWTVKNQSTRQAPNGWNDDLYFSTDTALDAEDTYLGTFWRGGTLDAGTSYQQTQRVRLPDVPSGTYYLFLKVDASNRLVESNDSNNTKQQSIAIQVTSLNPGTEKQLALGAYVRYYYEVTTEADKKLLLTLGTRPSQIQPGDGNQNIRVYVRKDKLPTEDNHEYTTQTPFDVRFAEIPIAPTSVGKYYVLVVVPYMPTTTTTLRSSYVDFHLSSISPNKASNVGSLTSEIKGTDLDVGTEVTLIGPSDQVITGTNLLSASPTSLFATFNLQSAAVGNYRLEIKRTSDGAVRTITNAVEVSQGTGGRLKVEIVGPEVVRRGRENQYTLVYQNVGDADLPAPFLSVTSSGSGTLSYLDGTSTQGMLIWFAPSAQASGNILAPGQGGSITFSATLQENSVLSAGIVQEDNTPFNWNAVEQKLKPAGINEAEWQVFWASAKSLGNTNGEVLTSLRLLNRNLQSPVALEQLLRLGIYIEGQPNTTGTNSPSLVEPNEVRVTNYNVATDVKIFDHTGKLIYLENGQLNPDSTFNPNNPAIIITHGWNGTEQENRFKVLASTLANTQLDNTYNVVRITWQQGAATPRNCPKCMWPAASHIPEVARTAREQLETLGYDLWSQTIYIGESFGNGVNAHISNNASAKGNALILNAADPAGYAIVGRPHYKAWFGKSISIQTDDLADDPFDVGNRRIHYQNPSCGDSRCNIWGESHTSGIRLLTCLLGGKDTDHSWGCGKVETNVDLARLIILSRWDTLGLEDRPYILVGSDGCLDEKGKLTLSTLVLPCVTPVTITDGYVTTSTFSHPINVVASMDPNDKIGPAGYGDMHLVPVDETLQYTVNFENQRTATAPVQELVVTDDLDPNLDWATLQFSEIAYGDRVLAIPEGSQSFSLRDYPSSSAVVGTAQGELAIDINGSLNPATGKITWHLRLIDTATGTFPEDPLAGFLMPEDGTGRGQGHVSFSIKPKSNISLGTRINNKATIVFDTNDPITTNEVWNTIGAVVDVALTQTASAETVSPGEQIAFKIHAYNDGANPANNVVMTDTLPQGLSFVSATASQGSCTGTETVTCSLGTLAHGNSATITIVATSTTSGSFTNTASIRSNDIERNEINNSASARITVTNQPNHLTFIPLVAR